MDAVQREVPPLAVPDVLVCSVGTEIFLESGGGPDEGWQRALDEGWDHSAAVAAAEGIPELKPQVGQSQGLGALYPHITGLRNVIIGGMAWGYFASGIFVCWGPGSLPFMSWSGLGRVCPVVGFGRSTYAAGRKQALSTRLLNHPIVGLEILSDSLNASSA